MIINQEGGYAAAVVGLMARERLAFHTEVPEQLVVLDPKLSVVDEQYVRILQRYKELLRNSDNYDPEVRILPRSTLSFFALCVLGSFNFQMTVRALQGSCWAESDLVSFFSSHCAYIFTRSFA